MSEQYKYEAVRVDETTWMVKRFDAQDNMTEALLRDCRGFDEASAIEFAVSRGSWA